MLRVQFFGRFRVWCDEKEITSQLSHLGKPKTILKILLARPSRIFTPDELIESLWPEMPLSAATNNLRKRVSELRQMLEPNLSRGNHSEYILTHPSGYSFNDESPYSTDTQAFLKAFESGQKAEHSGQISTAIRDYEKALLLIQQGSFLEEDRYDDWALAIAHEWEEREIALLDRLADCYGSTRAYPQALTLCERILRQRPWRECTYRRQMLYLFHSGQHDEAVLSYRRCAKMLRANLETAPSPETRGLYEQIRMHRVPELPRIIPNNLPVALTSFINRERDLAQLKQISLSTRLLTLTGPGGCGKTRLALQLASTVLEDFSDGVWLIDLSAISKPAEVPRVIAITLGLDGLRCPSWSRTLIGHLRDKKILLLLDNCEHLVAPCARLAEELLCHCPKLRMFATSREALGLIGEAVWQVRPLELPDLEKPLPHPKILRQYPAITLFVERASLVLPTFTVTPQNAPAVVEICRRLDGLPLAIELAASRVRVLSVEQIAQRLDTRFNLLNEGSRTVPRHHQTLSAAIAWSYQLLSEKERALFRRISIFAGEFSLEDAKTLCADLVPPAQTSEIAPCEILQLLSRLANKSLLFIDTQRRDVYYRMLETIRQFGLDKLMQERSTDPSQNLAAVAS